MIAATVGAMADGDVHRYVHIASLTSFTVAALLENLPKAVLAAVVLTAVSGLFDFPALFRMWRASLLDFFAAAPCCFSGSCRGSFSPHWPRF
jgi:MFS superfamily sulfate permease-like transporter